MNKFDKSRNSDPQPRLDAMAKTLNGAKALKSLLSDPGATNEIKQAAREALRKAAS